MPNPSFGDFVVLVQDRPDLGLRLGDVGQVCHHRFVPRETYEVDFYCEIDRRSVRASVKREQIEIADQPRSPFDQDFGDGRGLYF